MCKSEWSIFPDFSDERKGGAVMVEPLLGHHLQQESVQLLETGQGLHLEGTPSPVDQAVLARSALQPESQSSSQDLEKIRVMV